jgi:hypothetical protein
MVAGLGEDVGGIEADRSSRSVAMLRTKAEPQRQGLRAKYRISRRTEPIGQNLLTRSSWF